MSKCYFMLHLVSDSQKDFKPLGQTLWCYEIDRKNKIVETYTFHRKAMCQNTQCYLLIDYLRTLFK